MKFKKCRSSHGTTWPSVGDTGPGPRPAPDQRLRRSPGGGEKSVPKKAFAASRIRTLASPQAATLRQRFDKGQALIQNSGYIILAAFFARLLPRQSRQHAKPPILGEALRALVVPEEEEGASS